MDNKSELLKILSLLNFRSFSVLLGAGISIDSGIPMVGYVRKDNTVCYGIETYILSKLGFSIDEISKTQELIPFESFFEVLIDNGLDLDGFLKIFKSKPSTVHNFVAQMVARGYLNSIGTTNFDDCIEQALDNLDIKYVVSICNQRDNQDIQNRNKNNIIRKFHGSINESENLGISIKNITSKNNLDIRKSDVQQFIESADNIIVLGYSCSDIFDLTPFFSSIDNCKTKNIIYISHTDDNTVNIISGERLKSFPKVYNMFHGYNLKIIRCNTVKFIHLFEDYISISNTPIVNHVIQWQEYIDSILNKFDTYELNKIKGNLYFRISEMKKSISSLESAIENTNNKECIIACKRSIAWAYDKMGYYDDSRRILEELCIDDELALRYPLHCTNIYSQLGICYTRKSGGKEKADEYFKLAYDIASKNQFKRELGYVLINWAELHKKNGYYEEALQENQEALEMLISIGYFDDVGICYSNIAEILMKLNELIKAKENIEAAIKIAKDLGNYNALFNRCMIKHEINLKMYIQDAIKEMNEIGQSVMSGDNLEMKANYNFFMGKLFHIDGDTENAINKWNVAKKIYEGCSVDSDYSLSTIQYLDEHKSYKV